MRKQRMKALISVASLLMIAFASGCLGSSKSSVAPNLAFVYVVGTGDNSIRALAQKSTGDLVPLPLSIFPANPRPVALALHPSKNFIYAPNLTSNTVSGFTLDHTTGVLAPVGTALPPTPVGSNPVGVGVNSAGFLFVLNQGSVSPAAPASISVFSVDPARGLLSQVAGSPFSFASLTAPNPQILAVSPTANLLYVSNGPAGTISGFAIGSGGGLTEVVGSPFAAGGNIAGITIDAKGQFIYAADTANSKIASFSIQSNGSLTPVAGSPFAADLGPVAIALDSNSTFLYCAEQGAAGVSAFKVSSGALTKIAGSPFAIVPSGNPLPAFLIVDPSNTFLYVGNEGTHNISALNIKSDGTLVPLTSGPFPQAVGPQWILITP
jgi:6-phosphogluconolactonase (cycloisomerase 2 family)